MYFSRFIYWCFFQNYHFLDILPGPGGHLVISEAKITGACQSTPWQPVSIS